MLYCSFLSLKPSRSCHFVNHRPGRFTSALDGGCALGEALQGVLKKKPVGEDGGDNAAGDVDIPDPVAAIALGGIPDTILYAKAGGIGKDWTSTTKVANGWETGAQTGVDWRPVQSIGSIESTVELF
jgi:hypothetical protein